MIADRIRAALTAPLAARGLVVEDLTVQAAGRRRVVRVAVGADLADLPEQDTTSRVAPLSLDEIADATRAFVVARQMEKLLGICLDLF